MNSKKHQVVLGIISLILIGSINSCTYYKEVGINPIGENPWKTAISDPELPTANGIKLFYNDSYFKLTDYQTEGEFLKGELVSIPPYYIPESIISKGYVPIGHRKQFLNTLFMSTHLLIKEGEIILNIEEVFGLTRYYNINGAQGGYYPQEVTAVTEQPWKEILTTHQEASIFIQNGDKAYELKEFTYKGAVIQGILTLYQGHDYKLRSASFKEKEVFPADKDHFFQTLYIESNIPLKEGDFSLPIKDIYKLTRYKKDVPRSLMGSITLGILLGGTITTMLAAGLAN